MLNEKFKVFRVSENANSFGLKKFYIMSKKGVAFTACANSINIPKKGEVINVPVNIYESTDGSKRINYDLTSRGFELPERLSEDAPPEVVEEVWNMPVEA